MTEPLSVAQQIEAHFNKIATGGGSVHSPLSGFSELLQMGMALPPCFNEPMLQTLSAGTPLPPDALAALAAQGVVETQSARSRSSDLGFGPRRNGDAMTLTGAVRLQTIQAFLDRKRAASLEPQAQLRASYVQVASQLRPMASKLPDIVQRWSEFAILANNGRAMADRLDALVTSAFDRADTAELPKWIEAARPFAELLESSGDVSMKLALQRAGRQLELLLRQHADLVLLEDFFERREQIDALEKFVTGPPELWQFHLLGAGGIGKTMLLRHFTIRMARSLGFLTARVDYDYLSPDYPLRDPGLLIWALGRELRRQDQSSLALKKIDEAENVLQELRGRTRDQPQGERPIDHPVFREALSIYTDAFRLLPDPRKPLPIVLVLDTCEELVRRRSSIAGVDAVTETFRIIGALKHGVKFLDDEKYRGGGLESLRVLFSGRRPLASAGMRWTAESPLAPRPDLQLYELSGFSPAEAREWLAKLGVPAGLVEPVIAATPEVLPTGLIHWPKGRAVAPPGLNPYDLRHFAEWALQDPPPNEKDLASGSTNHYVELRILRRLPVPELERLLPAVAVLKSFDHDLLAASIGDPALPQELFDQLVDLEWISRRVAGSGDEGKVRTIYEADEVLRARLLTYFAIQGVNLAALAKAAQSRAVARCQMSLDDVELSDVDAALRTFAWDPEPGRRWWDELVKRALAERGFEWLLRLTNFLLGDGQSAGPAGLQTRASQLHQLRPDVLATEAATLARLGQFSQSESTWQEVIDAISSRTDEAAAVLRARAGMGRIVALPPVTADDLRLALSHVRDLWTLFASSVLDSNLAASFVSAFETLVEQLEAVADTARPVASAVASSAAGPLLEGSFAGRLHALFLPDPHESRILSAERDLVAFAWSLSARAAGFCDRPQDAMRFFDAACDVTQFEHGRPHRVLEWTPPYDTAARVRAELCRAALPREWIEARLTISDLRDAAIEHRDHDRYWAARLQFAAFARGEKFFQEVDADQPLLDRMLAAPVPDAEGDPRTCHVHRKIPHAAIVAAETVAARGQIGAGTSLLSDLLRRSQGLDPGIVLHCERALARLMPRLRMPYTELPLLAQSQLPGDVTLLRYARLVADPSVFVQSSPVYAPPSSAASSSSAPAPSPVSADEPELPGRAGAEQLWTTGDLWAQSLVDEAEPYLTKAQERFSECGDRMGAFVCAARRAVLWASAPRRDTHIDFKREIARRRTYTAFRREQRQADAAEAERRVGRLRAALSDARTKYEALRESRDAVRDMPALDWGSKDLPGWSAADLEGVRKREKEWGVQDRGWWIPWLVRLSMCQLRLGQLENGQLRFTEHERQTALQLLPGTQDVLALVASVAVLPEEKVPEPEVATETPTVLRRAIEQSAFAQRLIGSAWLVAAEIVASFSFLVLPSRHTSDGAPADGPLDLVSRTMRARSRQHLDLAAKARPSAAWPRLVELGRWIQRGASVVLGLSLFYGFFRAVQPYVRQPITFLYPGYASWTGWGGVVIDFFVFELVLVAAGTAIVQATALARRRRTRGTRFELTMQTISGGDRSAEQDQVSLRGVQRVPHLLWPGQRELPMVNLEVAIDPRQSPVQLADHLGTLPDELLGWLKGSENVPITLLLKGDRGPSFRAPWEGMLASAVGHRLEAGEIQPSALLISRSVNADLQSRPTSVRSAGAELLVLSRQRSAQSIAASVWTNGGGTDTLRGAEGSDVLDDLRLDEAKALEAPNAASRHLKVMHIVGDPVGTSRDVRLRLSESGESSGRLEEASQLAAWAASTTLCVVQANLVPQFIPRQTSDRRDSANLREFASELHRAGVPRVIAIPPVTSEIATRALGVLSAALRDGADSRGYLVAVAAVRQIIADGQPDPKSQDAFELSWDVCLLQR